MKSVADFDQRLLTVKGWGVTLSLPALGLGFRYRVYGFFLIAAAGSLAFWVIEHAAMRHQMRPTDVCERFSAGGPATCATGVGDRARCEISSQCRNLVSLKKCIPLGVDCAVHHPCLSCKTTFSNTPKPS